MTQSADRLLTTNGDNPDGPMAGISSLLPRVTDVQKVELAIRRVTARLKQRPWETSVTEALNELADELAASSEAKS